MRRMGCLAVLTLAACAAPVGPALSVEGASAAGTRSSASWEVDPDGAGHLSLTLSTGNDVDASDTVAFFAVYVDLAADVRAGDVLVVDGDATLDDAGALASFAPRLDHDARVRATWLTVLAFSSGAGPYVQRTRGTVEIREIDATHAVVSVDLTTTGDIFRSPTTRVRITGLATTTR